MALVYMSDDDVGEMMDANELSARFRDDIEEADNEEGPSFDKAIEHLQDADYEMQKNANAIGLSNDESYELRNAIENIADRLADW